MNALPHLEAIPAKLLQRDSEDDPRALQIGPIPPAQVGLSRLGRTAVIEFIDAFASPERAFDDVLAQILHAIRTDCAFSAQGAIEGVVFELAAIDSYFGRAEFLILGPDDLQTSKSGEGP